MDNGILFDPNGDGTYLVKYFNNGACITYPRAIIQFDDARIMGEILSGWNGELLSFENDETKIY